MRIDDICNSFFVDVMISVRGGATSWGNTASGQLLLDRVFHPNVLRLILVLEKEGL